ncbi:hypothetical protein AX16_011025 [Volvariella volvacea WC 439]|nr:hypothetical protein AX16_011025 [Volvariella volvacea WC 439]
MADRTTKHHGLNEDDDDRSSIISAAAQDDSHCRTMTPTPLPKLQLFIIIFIQISEPVTSTVIYPFVNDLIRSLGVTNGDEKQTGYYVGIVESIFYAAEALTVVHWGRASDIIGRRPILLGGVAGLAFSMLGFGLSKYYWMLILSRCMQGAFNGNIGVMKSVMGEITDSTNAAQAFSFLPVAWSIGSTVGPLIGGAFANPAEQWPELFGKISFLKVYPYFLPCFVAALVPVCAFLLAFIALKETLPSAKKTTDSPGSDEEGDFAHESFVPTCETRLLRNASSSTVNTDYGTLTNNTLSRSQPNLGSASTSPSSTAASSTLSLSSPKPSFQEVFIPQVLIPISNFAFLAFLDQSFLVLLPLIYSTPLELGGLALSPSRIGSILGGWGVLNGFVQVFLFPRLRRRVGHRNLYVAGIAALGVGVAMFPLLNWMMRLRGARDGHVLVWCGVGVQLGLYMLTYMSYACMFMYISASTPSRFLLGTTNGLAQLTASSMRALAPTTASSLFSLSLELCTLGGVLGKLGGYLVYVVFVLIPAVAVGWSMKLPEDV